MKTITSHAWIGALSLLCALFCTELRAQIKTGVSEFWQNLEAGVAQTFSPMGTSVSQSKNSYWPNELETQLKQRFGETFVKKEGYTARQGHNSSKGLENTLYTVVNKKPDAVTIEYSIVDARTDKGVSLAQSKSNLERIIDSLRALCPGVEIFLWKAIYPMAEVYREAPNFVEYYHLMEQVAYEKQTYFINTFDRTKAIFDSLTAIGKQAEYATWVWDTHHPSLYAATELIVPAMIAAFSGSSTAGHRVALALGSMNDRVYYVGDTLRVEWVHDPDRIQSVRVGLSLDAGQRFTLLTQAPVSESPFVWPIQPELEGISTVSDSAVVRVSATDDGYAATSAPFRIAPDANRPILEVYSLDGERFAIGDTVPVRWSYDPNKVTSFDVAVSLDNGRSFIPLTQSSIETDHFDWAIPAMLNGKPTASTQTIIRVKNYTDEHESFSGSFTIALADPQEILIDNADPAVLFAGEWSTSTASADFHGANYAHDGNLLQGQKSATYSATPDVPGMYEVSLWWSEHPNRASNALVSVHHDGGVKHTTVNQQINGGRWNAIGVFSFSQTAEVTIGNTGANGIVVADAVRLVQITDTPTATSWSHQRECDRRPPVTLIRGRLALPPGVYRVRLFDPRGVTLFSRTIDARATASVPLPRQPGVRLIRVESGSGETYSLAMPGSGLRAEN